jgi:hypothetical protein
VNHFRVMLAMYTAVGLIGSACVRSAEPATFGDWCASVPVGDCVQMATEVAAGNIDPACVMATDSAEEASRCFGAEPPQTTVPPAETTVPSPPDRASVARAVEEIVVVAHPDAVVSVAVSLREPTTLEDAGVTADRFGSAVAAVWRVDQVCVPASGGFPGLEPTRFAWIDGVERARELRRAADEGRTVVTGRVIAEAAWDRMAAAASALTADTEIVAFAVEIPVAALPAVRTERAVMSARIIPYGVEAAFDDGTLPAARGVDCGE